MAASSSHNYSFTHDDLCTHIAHELNIMIARLSINVAEDVQIKWIIVFTLAFLVRLSPQLHRASQHRLLHIIISAANSALCIDVDGNALTSSTSRVCTICAFTISCFISEWHLSTQTLCLASQCAMNCASTHSSAILFYGRKVKLEREFAACKLWLTDWQIRHSCVLLLSPVVCQFPACALHGSNIAAIVTRTPI